MKDYSIEASPQVYARTGGALYLIIIVLGIFGEAFVRGRLIVAGDAVATAANIMAMESLWRFGIAAEFLALICTITLAMIYFFLLRPVSKELNLLATFFRLISIMVEAVAALNLVTALFPLGNAASLKSFTPEQLYALTSLATKSHSYGFSVSLLFLGCCFLIHGRLIFKSGYLPRALGILIQVAGVGYLTNGFALLLYPAVANKVFLAIIIPVFVAETSLSLWLLVKGVNVQKFKESAGVGAVDAPLQDALVGESVALVGE
jgi:hypothetical protein